MQVSAESTRLFVGPAEQPNQVLRVAVRHRPGRTVTVRAEAAGDRIRSVPPASAETGDADSVTVELAVDHDLPVGAAERVKIFVTDGDERAETELDFVAHEPGWTMYLVSHFHYDPVWWNTQAAYTSTWDIADDTARGEPRRPYDYAGSTGFTLVRAHCDLARREPEYTFVLAEIDYLKPYWDAFPEERAYLRHLIRTGRVEIMGGTYNEPNTNLTGAETTARNALYGMLYQRDVLGADPATAWQLDAFGHDPQFPGLMADAGLSSSSWARGPFHQWGPSKRMWSDPIGPATDMQFPSEFWWMSPSGRGLLTAFMANHYGAGWDLEQATTLAEAQETAYRLFCGLAEVASTRNVLLPVGGDYAPPCRWVMGIHREWHAKYVWPRFVSALPREFFAAVRAELAEREVVPAPQTRDMNPVYTGKDVSYIDTKQAQRRGETLLADAETLATLASLLTGAPYPDALLDKAWRQLVYGAHHDAITGSESDQVYVDLVTGWREVVDLAAEVHDWASELLADEVTPAEEGAYLVVVNPANWTRRDVLVVDDPGAVPVDEMGRPLPAVVEDGRLHVLVSEVPGVGLRAVPLRAGRVGGWERVSGTSIRNEFYALTVDPARGGGVTRLVSLADGREWVRDGSVGNEITLQPEYPEHPDFGEGPWHLLPTGAVSARSAAVPAEVVRERSAAGNRLTVRYRLGELDITQRLTLWNGIARVEASTTVHGFGAADVLARVRWPMRSVGALPVSEVADAVVGRGFGFPDSDSARQPWTLDNPCHTWFGLSATALFGARAVGVAELVFADWADAGALGTELAAALVRAGVTATSAVADGPRYGFLDVDSNLPDVRIAVGMPARNSFVASALAAHPALASVFEQRLAADGYARVWVPAARPLREVWVPQADLRAAAALPVLVVAGVDAAAEAKAVAELVAELADARVEVGDEVGDTAEDAAAVDEAWDGGTVAVLHRGTPGFVVTSDGDLVMSLFRSCTGWPSGVWIDPPRRTAPDGSGFGLQHWTHRFEYAIVGEEGDWRESDLPRRGHEFNHPLTAVHRSGDAATGALPASTQLLAVEPGCRVIVDAVKPASSPLARGSTAVADPADGVLVRLHETTGRAVNAVVRGPLPWRSAFTSSVVEAVGDPLPVDVDGLRVGVDGFGISTVVGQPGAGSVRCARDGLVGGEPVQPVFTRYWLHNAGPAPRGNQPVGVFLAPAALTVSGPTAVTVRVSSELAVPWAGVVRLRAPEGWSVTPAELPVSLGPAGFTITDATVTAAGAAEPGRYWLTADLEHDGQTFQDVIALDVVGSTHPSFEVSFDRTEVVVAAGTCVAVGVRVANLTRDVLRGTVWAVSPFGTWEGISPAVDGFAVAGGESVERVITVDGRRIAPGEYWLLAKVGAHGQVAYSPAIPVRVR